MRIQIIPFLIFLLTIDNISPVFAQANIGIAGGDFIESDIKFSYTVGQTFYTSFHSTDHYLSQGTHHPTLKLEAIIDTTTTLSQASLDVAVFPNPVQELLNLRLNESVSGGRSSFVLNDLNGIKILEGTLSNKLISIPFSDYPMGIYLLRIYEGKKIAQTFKVIKE